LETLQKRESGHTREKDRVMKENDQQVAHIGKKNRRKEVTVKKNTHSNEKKGKLPSRKGGRMGRTFSDEKEEGKPVDFLGGQEKNQAISRGQLAKTERREGANCSVKIWVENALAEGKGRGSGLSS